MNSTGKATPSIPRSPWEIRVFTILAAATVWVAAFVVPAFWTITGIGEADKPFLDLRNILAASESVQLGEDPYTHNIRDPYNRPHGYSAWWLVIARFGVDRSDLAWIGALLLGLTLGSAVWLAGPATWREGRAVMLVLTSPALLMAVNRLNHDLFVFILMAGALACFRTSSGPARTLGVLLLAISAVLKYFPLAAVILLLEARTRRELTRWTLAYGLVLLLAWPSLARGFQVARSVKPSPDWLYAFGAPVLFRNFEFPSATLLGGVLAGAMLLAGALAARPTLRAAGAWATPSADFACGAVMIIGCFLHGSSYIYKLVFALFLARGLWQPAMHQGEERWRRLTWKLLLVVLWFEGSVATLLNLAATGGVLPAANAEIVLRIAMGVEQLATWGLVACLWRYLIIYLDQHLRRWLKLMVLPVPHSHVPT